MATSSDSFLHPSSDATSSALTLAWPTFLTGSIGSLDAYIQMVNRLPMLSAEEEAKLANAYFKNQHLESARRLVLSHLRLVVSVARHYLGYGLPHEDLIQEGNIGLMKAVKRFDPTRNIRLVSYALHWIKAEIHDYIIRNWRMVKMVTTKAQRKLFFNLRRHKTEGHTLSTNDIDAIAETLNVKPAEVREMEKRFNGGEIALDPLEEHDDSKFSAINYLSDPALEPSEALAHHQHEQQKKEGLAAALDVLDARSRRIIEARWLNQDEEGNARVNLQQLGEEMGVSAERVRQIQDAALKKMRGVLAEYAV